MIDLGARGNGAAISAGGVQSDDAEAEQDGGLGPAEPDDWFLVQRAGGPGKTLEQGAFAQAARQAQALRDAGAAERTRSSRTRSGAACGS